MRPLSLYLRNFKSYGEDAPVLDFNLFDIALLSGDNGNGKSSLADAIAWCMWGKCKGMDGRGGVDDLVRTGADEMEVTFWFEEEGEVYKVIRKRDKRRGLSSLDFLMKQGDAFVPISGNRIDETQRKIQEVIKLDYETYLCTGYLSQGKADLFAVKKPNERKEILAEILNLSVYEKLERKALDKRNEVQGSLDLLEREIEGLERQIAEKDLVNNDIAQVTNAIEGLQVKEKNLKEQLNVLNNQRQEKEVVKKKLEDYREHVNRGRKELSALEKDRDKLKTRLEAYKKALESEAQIEKDYAEFKRLEEQGKTLAHKFQLVAELNNKRERLRGEMRIKEQEIRHGINMLEREIEQSQMKIEQLDTLQREWQVCQKNLDELNVLEKELGILEERLAEIGRETANINAREGSLCQQLEELKERYAALKSAEYNCPVCGKPLEKQHRDELMQDIAIQGKTIQQYLQESREAAVNFEKERRHIETQIKGMKVKLNNRGKLEAQAALISRQIKEIEQAGRKVDELTGQLKPLIQQLESKSYVKDIMHQLEELQRQIQQIGYDSNEHGRIQEEINRLAKVPSQWEAVRKARVQMNSDLESLERINGLINDRKRYIEDMECLINNLQIEVKDLPQIQIRISELEKDIQSLQHDIRTIEARRGALKERMENIKAAERQLAGNREKQRQLQQQLEVYKALAQIYSKRGIQAAIIENAIPELQDETNRILAKITDGRLAVEFLTQRDTKSGSVLETLDIKISDGMDTRKYETYSGGEEFRINFAIRIALAKILANRAGANMRMLILDEGFGVLDEQGRERLVEVINAIRDEFDKILVITHVQELKDSFPVQIEVIKTPTGSTFRLVG
jgi:exonuclease SbcC